MDFGRGAFFRATCERGNFRDKASCMDLTFIQCIMRLDHFMARWGKGLGVLGVVAALMGWHGSDRPDILIAKDGVLVGLPWPEGRALSKPNGGTFSAGIWAQNDGLPMPREKAYALWQDRKIDLYHHWSNKKKGLEIACVPGELHIVAQKRPISGECWHLSHHIIKRNGTTAVWLDHQGKPTKIRHINSGFTRLWSKHR